VNNRPEFFYVLAMKSTTSASPNPTIDLHQAQARPLIDDEQRKEATRLLDVHRYLKDERAVGERIGYGVFVAEGEWLGALVFCAASRRLQARNGWIR